MGAVPPSINTLIPRDLTPGRTIAPKEAVLETQK